VKDCDIVRGLPFHSVQDQSNSVTERHWFVDEIDNVESNPLLAATIAVSVFAGVVLILAVILLIMLIKQRADNKRSYCLC